MSFDTTTGRWMEQDPAGYIDGPNEYQMEDSNPINSVDPTGLDPSPTTQPAGQPTSQPNPQQLVEARLQAVKALMKRNLDLAEQQQGTLDDLNLKGTADRVGSHYFQCYTALAHTQGLIDGEEKEIADLEAILKQMQPPPTTRPVYPRHPTTAPTTQPTR